VLVALAVSGLPSEHWRFSGFLPRKAGELRTLLLGAGGQTLVAFESPRRLGASLAVLAEVDPGRPVAICRELTKLYEEVVRGTSADLAARYADAEVKGEIVLVVGPAPVPADGDEDLGPALQALRDLVTAGAKPRPAAKVVASLTGTSANALYRALTEKR
jgi:16S rRNA (cytidine1402-2'-O)-methyltransferase